MKRYKITLKNGDELIINASSKLKASELAFKKSLQVARIEEVQYFSFKQKLKDYDLLVFFKELAILLSSNISLQVALTELEKNSTKSLKPFLQKLTKLVNSAQNLHTAFKNSGFKFSNTELSLIEIAQHTGELSLVFEKLSELRQKKIENSKKLKKALAYPCFVFLVLILAFFLVMLFVIPQFKSLFDEFNVSLPLLTRVFLSSYEVLEKFYILFIAVPLITLFALIILYKTNNTFSYLIDKIIMKIPILSKLIFYAQSSQFFFVFSLLNENKIELVKALTLAKTSYENKFLARKIDELIKFVRQGLSLEKAFAKIKLYDGISLSMISIAMQSAKLDELSKNISFYYEDKADSMIAVLLTLIEPIMTFFVASLLLFLALAIFLPMWELNNISNF